MPILFRHMRPIDPEVEEIITLNRAARDVPPSGVSPATFARWQQRGVRVANSDERVRPATILIGGRRFTSVEAMKEFFAAQNATESPAPSFTPSQRHKQAEVANRLLAEALSVTNSPVPSITPSQRHKQKLSSDDTFSKPTAETANKVLAEVLS